MDNKEPTTISLPAGFVPESLTKICLPLSCAACWFSLVCLFADIYHRGKFISLMTVDTHNVVQVINEKCYYCCYYYVINTEFGIPASITQVLRPSVWHSVFFFCLLVLKVWTTLWGNIFKTFLFLGAWSAYHCLTVVIFLLFRRYNIKKKKKNY